MCRNFLVPGLFDPLYLKEARKCGKFIFLACQNTTKTISFSVLVACIITFIVPVCKEKLAILSVFGGGRRGRWEGQCRCM